MGTITLAELKQVMIDKFQISDHETNQIFLAMDSNQDETIHYSDFLAAMMNTRISMHADLLRSAFRRFDTDNSGYITVENLREVLGDNDQVEHMLAEADVLKDNRISYSEFVAFVRGTPHEEIDEAAAKVIDDEMTRRRKRISLSTTVSMDDANAAARKFWSAVPGMVKLNGLQSPVAMKIRNSVGGATPTPVHINGPKCSESGIHIAANQGNKKMCCAIS